MSTRRRANPDGYAKAVAGRIRKVTNTLGQHGRVLADVVTHAILTGHRPAVKDTMTVANALRRAGHVQTARQLERVSFKANPPSKHLRRRYDFFKKHAGSIVGRVAEGAKLLADAEEWASARGVTFEWSYDVNADRSWEEEAGYDGPGEYEFVVATDPDTGLTESLSGIVDADNNYRRVVEAELALELKNEIG